MNKRFPLRGSLVMCAVARQARIGHGGKTGDIGNGRRGIYWQPCRVGVARCRLWRCRHRQSHHRSEEHTSELQSLMRISYAVFCLKKTKKRQTTTKTAKTNKTYEYISKTKHN